MTTIFRDIETRNFALFWLFCKLRFKFSSEKQIRKYQERKIRSLLSFSITKSPFFRRYYKGLDLKKFSSLPLVNKKIMMDNLTDYNTAGLTKEQIINFCLEVEKNRDFSKRLNVLDIGMSSGTSGNKGVEIVSRREESYMKAALFARFDFPKGEKFNLAFILRVSAPAFSLNKFGHKLTYISQLGSVEEICRQLDNVNPNVISAPPSMLKILAKEKEHNRLSVQPKRIISYAEILYPDVKSYLLKIFQCPVHEIYKCTEGPIAITCRHGSLHINEDLVFVETVNDDGTETIPGNPCRKLIITDLHKTSQPIIRYALNDIITISPGRCPCGSSFRVIEKIEGRSDDLFWARNTETQNWQFIFPDYISRAIISSSEKIDEYQAIQNSPDDILVRLQLKDKSMQNDFEEDVLITNIGNVFREYHCNPPVVKILYEEPEINKNSNKLIRMQRNFALND
jgi:putative adenylate-forming enzyme